MVVSDAIKGAKLNYENSKLIQMYGAERGHYEAVYLKGKNIDQKIAAIWMYSLPIPYSPAEIKRIEEQYKAGFKYHPDILELYRKQTGKSINEI